MYTQAKELKVGDSIAIGGTVLKFETVQTLDNGNVRVTYKQYGDFMGYINQHAEMAPDYKVWKV